MRWQGQRESGNVEDRRGSPGRRLGVGGGIGGVVIVIIYLLLGGDPRQLVQVNADRPGEQGSASDGTTGTYVGTPEDEELRRFVGAVLARTEDTWNGIFRQMGQSYAEPRLVLFTEAIDSGCGFAEAAVGPFYCPSNGKVYIDLSFFRELRSRFGAPGDFAQAYVIAHEIGHHVQNLLGISNKVEAAGARLGEQERNALSVRVELQADCFAGVWAHDVANAHDLLEDGDVEEAMRAAGSIGDDRIQMQSRGYVAPESFTHGSAEQRIRWFRRGIESGSVDSCDTYSAGSL